MTDWFEQWFGEEYLRLYPHRDDHDAEQLAALVARHVPLEGQHLLDLACGPGRHALHFRRHGADVVGFDLSLALLTRARHRSGSVLPRLVRGDMRRLPFRAASFDVVVNLFTSFGYFEADSQHGAVLRGAAAVLRQAGSFVLDYLNARFVRGTLVAYQEQEIGDEHVIVTRRISRDDRFVVKEIRMLGQGRSFVERVRLYSSDELEDMLRNANLTVRQRFGDYTGGRPTTDAPRVILIAERS